MKGNKVQACERQRHTHYGEGMNECLIRAAGPAARQDLLPGKGSRASCNTYLFSSPGTKQSLVGLGDFELGVL